MPTNYDYIIIGAGPAGLQLAYYLQKKGYDYVILEKEAKAGAFFEKYPRNRQLISINKIYTGYDDKEINLRWDWNSLLCDNDDLLFKHYSKDYLPDAKVLVNYLNDFSDHYQLNISFNTEVAKISKKNDQFIIQDKAGETYIGKRLIMATGMFKPYIPKIEGAHLVRENYGNVSVDPMDFCDQRVLIFGKGNSAFELAENLLATTSLIHLTSPQPVKMAWRSHYVGHLRAVNNNLLDTYMLKSQNALINGEISKIEKAGEKYRVSIEYNLANDEVEQLDYDRIIFATGFEFDDSLFDDSCKPAMAIHNRFPDQTSDWESVNVKDLYFAGVLMHMRDYKKKQSGFIHGFRYNIAIMSRLFSQKYHQEKLPFEALALSPEKIGEKIIERVNKTSSLWQQTGYLADLVVLDFENQKARYYESLPVDYIKESDLGQNEFYYVITLEFGQDLIDKTFDIFAIDRVHKDDYGNADKSTGLHPIVRGYSKNELRSVHHVIEDFASEWKEEVHSIPLEKYFQHEIEHSPVQEKLTV